MHQIDTNKMSTHCAPYKDMIKQEKNNRSVPKKRDQWFKHGHHNCASLTWNCAFLFWLSVVHFLPSSAPSLTFFAFRSWFLFSFNLAASFFAILLFHHLVILICSQNLFLTGSVTAKERTLERGSHQPR